MSSVAVVVPTIPERKEIFDRFMSSWQSLFEKHDVEIIIVQDGKVPLVHNNYLANGDYLDSGKKATVNDVMGEYGSCISNFNGGVRNLGFAFVARYSPEIETIITLDDDVIPIDDPIQAHLDALATKAPISWMSTASDFTRGFPYAVREEAEVVLSHGVWHGVADWDAPTQLVKGSHRPVEFYKGAIPKGVYYPMCSMNLAFKRKILPYIYHAPWANGVKRFDDIFAGITSKRAIDRHGWAVVSGYAEVHHERASNVFSNLEREALGIRLNETFWQGDEEHEYFKIYKEKLQTWQKFIKTTSQ